MGSLHFANHLLSFAAPALFLALVLTLFGPLLVRGGAPVHRALAFGVNLLCGLLVLAAGLWVFGRDGKMATYAALVVVVGSSQWLMMRGWRGKR
jgi:hypothetical protein